MISGRAELLVVLREAIFQRDEVARVVEVGRDVTDPLGEVVPERALRLLAVRHEELELLAAVLAEAVVVVLGAREADQREIRRKRPVESHRIDRRQQHALEQIAARAEEDDTAGIRDAIRREALAQRIDGCAVARRVRLCRERVVRHGPRS